MADNKLQSNQPDELLSVKKLAERINISEYNIRQYAREGKIPSYKMGKKWLFDPVEVITAIKNNCSKIH